jgi:hypothetical protein
MGFAAVGHFRMVNAGGALQQVRCIAPPAGYD